MKEYEWEYDEDGLTISTKDKEWDVMQMVSIPEHQVADLRDFLDSVLRGTEEEK